MSPRSMAPRSTRGRPRIAAMERPAFGWLLRLFALGLVLAMALYAFRAGVDVSDRPGLPDADLATHVYYALGLFVLGGLDLGTPVAGPSAARVTLWAAYFLAPLITTSAVVEGALRLVGSGYLERFGLRGHVVVVGMGRLGTSFVAAFRERDGATVVVGVDRDVSGGRVAQARRRFRVRMFAADARTSGALEPLSLSTASAVALLTDDDLVNLEAAFGLAKEHPHLRIVAHVSDIAIQRAVAEVRDEAERAVVHVFNSHRVAAEKLYFEHLRGYFAGTEAKDRIVLGGFGRFGQTILEFLEQEAGRELAKAVIVDSAAGARVRAFREQIAPDEPCLLEALDADLADPDTWNSVREALGSPDGAEPVVVLGCDNDRINLRAAMLVRARWPMARVFVRCQNESSFTEELSRRYDFAVLAVDAMLLPALKQAQEGWLS